ncbi:carboxymuconolactone decarboxylase family protein [Saccharopolyspora sp. HNM0983]|uniref:Carboxymuconolactone decarboxylase family protein n=1 Tax=Saccharopolyspora montiporae TaxID=2781240 RepID=A0A929B797_9PSEU|nr:carboxymuconolactone decarboxylase family protein [Saccharopolyspora sp. HNM0983]MBE9372898.1 carboxymuconolactone decarboxylase family protein [Saccharopolyspora sp. HNM0983]
MEDEQQLREEARAAFKAAHGYWHAALDDLLRVDPRYVAAYDRLLRVTSERGHLSPVQRELIGVAVNAQVTYLNPVYTRHHVGEARRLGASEAEVVETLQLAASLGVHSMLVGVPIAHEVFEELGVAASPQLDKHAHGLKEDFIRERKYWSPPWDTVLAYTPEYFDAYLGLSRIPWVHGVLEESFKELIYVAIDVVTTHLFVSGIRVHVRKAIEYGATPDQVIDVITIASNIGVHSTLMGASQMGADQR